jgi:P pilus assembly chaperone PapD
MRRLMILFFILLFPSLSYAGVLASKTRIIFPQGQDAQSLTLINVNAYPVMVQLWLDNGDPEGLKQAENAPYLAMPPVFKLAPREMRSVRIIYNGKPLPADRESIHWFNIYEVPATPPAGMTARQSLLMAMKTQMKLISRPHALIADAEKSVDRVQCQRANSAPRQLICSNPTAYYISFNEISVNINDHYFNAAASLDFMIAPFSSTAFALRPAAIKRPLARNSMEMAFINDEGKIVRRLVKW